MDRLIETAEPHDEDREMMNNAMYVVLVVLQLAALAVAVVLFRSWRRVLDPVRTFAAAAIFAGIAGWKEGGLVDGLAGAATFGVAGMWGTGLLGPARGTPRNTVQRSPFAWPSVGRATFVVRWAIFAGGVSGFVLLLWDLGPPILQGAVTSAVVLVALLDLLIADTRQRAALRRSPRLN
jgi:hypothetical protein